MKAAGQPAFTGHQNDADLLAPGITDINRFVGLTRDGVPFAFAVNRLNDAQFAGACFSPDGRVLFVNIFGYEDSGSRNDLRPRWSMGR